MEVSLMITCLADALRPAVGIATVGRLRRLGVSVHFPSRQTCCGQPFFNSAAPAFPQPDALGTAVLLAMFLLALLGRRLSHRWRQRQGILTLALVSVALPSVVTYGDLLHGARMPIDGVFLFYAAFAVASAIPRYGRRLRFRFQEPSRENT